MEIFCRKSGDTTIQKYFAQGDLLKGRSKLKVDSNLGSRSISGGTYSARARWVLEGRAEDWTH